MVWGFSFMKSNNVEALSLSEGMDVILLLV